MTATIHTPPSVRIVQTAAAAALVGFSALMADLVGCAPVTADPPTRYPVLVTPPDAGTGAVTGYTPGLDPVGRAIVRGNTVNLSQQQEINLLHRQVRQLQEAVFNLPPQPWGLSPTTDAPTPELLQSDG